MLLRLSKGNYIMTNVHVQEYDIIEAPLSNPNTLYVYPNTILPNARFTTSNMTGIPVRMHDYDHAEIPMYMVDDLVCKNALVRSLHCLHTLILANIYTSVVFPLDGLGVSDNSAMDIHAPKLYYALNNTIGSLYKLPIYMEFNKQNADNE